MSNPSDPDRTAVTVQFLGEILADREAGSIRPLPEYQARYPGYEDLIAAEFAALTEAHEDSLHPVPDACDTISSLGNIQGDARYEHRTQVARGGMGIVLRVWDRHLRRDLAMKVIAGADDTKGTPGSPGLGSSNLSRFLDEAQITGQLAHPGIVPVHDLGIDDDGRVYFTMALIHGTEFRQIIDLVHDRAEDEWTLARATGIVLRVCEAVSYAHDKGFIHRDLKPSNIMVGSFGETYVLDWGLARATGEAVKEPPTDATRNNPSDPLRTMEGDVIGTPTYMAPEQARGDIERMGPCSDVYAIGAILYHLLSGQPPYHDSSRQQDSRTLVERVASGAPPPLHTIAANAPAELIAISTKAMQREPGDRYSSVAALASDLRAYLEIRVVHAYQTGALAEARKWTQRNRPLAITGAVAILALVLGLILSIMQKREADAQSLRADNNFQLASTAVDRMLSHMGGTRLANTPQMQRVRLVVLQEALEFHRQLLTQRSDDRTAQVNVAAALTQVARIHQLLAEYEDSETLGHEAIERWQTLAQADPAHLTGLLDARDQLGDVVALLGRPKEALAIIQDGLDEAEQFLQAQPNNHRILKLKAKLLNSISDSHADQKRFKIAVAPLQEAAEITRTLMKHTQPEERPLALTCSVLSNLGRTLTGLGQLDEAESALQEARDIATSGDAHELSRSRRHNLGILLTSLGNVQRKTNRVAEAKSTTEEAESIYRVLVSEYPGVPDYRFCLAHTLNNLANLTFSGGDSAKALTLLDESVGEYSTTIAIAPKGADYRKSLLATSRTLVGLLLDLGDYQRAAERAKVFETAKSRHGASFLAVCATRARSDESLSTEARTQLGTDYDQRALNCLRDVLATNSGSKGAKRWLGFVRKTEFNDLRTHPEFTQMSNAAKERLD